jgi:hypothetical protein
MQARKQVVRLNRTLDQFLHAITHNMIREYPGEVAYEFGLVVDLENLVSLDAFAEVDCFEFAQ